MKRVFVFLISLLVIMTSICNLSVSAEEIIRFSSYKALKDLNDFIITHPQDNAAINDYLRQSDISGLEIADEAVDLVDSIHCLPDIIAKQRMSITDSYWISHIKPYRNKWDKSFLVQEQKLYMADKRKTMLKKKYV
ncbi:MAG: hypothetical protein A2Y17_08115 [Clostridiales bacterium GWF2_38_85]|nr:MAG: hypothetical protein A2Y17_08115 [Clostridiales bacterium GWF2_38_85]HBL83843.1 hypothetical protein [Clostridiales bacterium]